MKIKNLESAKTNDQQPLADIIRPKNFDQLIGQEHLYQLSYLTIHIK